MSNETKLPKQSETVGDRICHLLQNSGMTQKELAKKIIKPDGTSLQQGTISRIIDGSITKSKYLTDIANILNVTVEWLLTGDRSANDIKMDGQNLRINDDEFMLIAMKPDIYGDIVDNTKDTSLMIHKTLLPPGTRAEDCGLFVQNDNSMTPKINDSNRIVYLEKEQKPISGKAYVVKYGELIMVRFLYPTHDGNIRIRAENADEFPETIVTKEQVEESIFKVLGRVISVTSSWL